MKMLSIQTSLRQQSKIAHLIIFRKCLILLCIVIVRNIGIKVCKILLVCVLLLLQRFKVVSAIVPFFYICSNFFLLNAMQPRREDAEAANLLIAHHLMSVLKQQT